MLFGGFWIPVAENQPHTALRSCAELLIFVAVGRVILSLIPLVS